MYLLERWHRVRTGRYVGIGADTTHTVLLPLADLCIRARTGTAGTVSGKTLITVNDYPITMATKPQWPNG